MAGSPHDITLDDAKAPVCFWRYPSAINNIVLAPRDAHDQ